MGGNPLCILPWNGMAHNVVYITYTLFVVMCRGKVSYYFKTLHELLLPNTELLNVVTCILSNETVW